MTILTLLELHDRICLQTGRQILVRRLDCLLQHSKGTLDGPDVGLTPICLVPSLLPFLIDFSEVPRHVVLVYILQQQPQFGMNVMDEEVVSGMAPLVLRLDDNLFLDCVTNIGATL